MEGTVIHRCYYNSSETIAANIKRLVFIKHRGRQGVVNLDNGSGLPILGKVHNLVVKLLDYKSSKISWSWMVPMLTSPQLMTTGQNSSLILSNFTPESDELIRKLLRN